MWLNKIRFFFKVGWPIASVVIDVAKDRKITKEELYEVIEVIMGEKDEIAF